MSTFQTAVLIIFGACLIVGFLIFAGVLPGFRGTPGGVGGTVVWWGTLPNDATQSLVADFNRNHRDQLTLEYVQKSEADFESEVVNALAAGRGPDIVSLPDSLLLRQGDKLFPLPTTVISQRTFGDTFINGANIAVWPSGIMGLPLTTDPLVAYYNRDLLASAGIASPPATWTSLLDIIPKLRQLDQKKNVLQGAVALGEVGNINNAKDILTALLFQVGVPITQWQENGLVAPALNDATSDASPVENVINFFLQFSNPASVASYTWNSSLPNSRALFTSGKLAIYFGYASELAAIRNENPHLNFDVSLFPQRGESNAKFTRGRMSFISVAKSSRNLQTAVLAAELVTSADFAGKLATTAGLVPARRDLLATIPADPYQALFYQAALTTYTWLDPDPAATEQALFEAVRSVGSGRATVSDARTRLKSVLSQLLPNR